MNTARFWAKVHKSDGCWEWTGSRTQGGNGYGQFWYEGKHVQAHRFAWQMERGPIPDGMFVCHKCDQPSCVRIDHLFIGTPAENAHDMLRKGRHSERRRAGCDNGHPYDAVNTRISRRGHRQCRVCQRISANARNAAKRRALEGEK